MNEDKLESISLKEYVDVKIAATSELFETKISAAEKAVSLASNTLAARLDLMNEFRMQLKDQAGSFFPRAEHDIYIKTVDKDIRELRESKASLEGKASQLSVNITLIIAIVGIFLSLFSVLHGWESSPEPVPIVQTVK